MMNRQVGPEHAADTLAELVAEVSYKPGWRIRLADMRRDTEHFAGSEGLTLCIAATVPNSTGAGTVSVEHWMAVPPASWDRPTWTRWILDQLLLVERHEAMEFFAVGDEKPYFPAHGPGRNPYTIG
jgi:hypothetical protein